MHTLLIPTSAHPWRYFATGFMYAVIGILTGLIFFPAHLSMAAMFITVIGCLPVIHALARQEENIAEKSKKFFTQYGTIIHMLFSLFVGIFAAYFVTALLLPAQFSAHLLLVQASMIGVAGVHLSFWTVLLDHMRYLFICVALSLLYGAGALILFVLSAGAVVAYLFELQHMSAIIPMSVAVILQILGFICAGIASGMIAVGITKHHVSTKRARRVIMDSGLLLILAVIALVASAIVRVTLVF